MSYFTYESKKIFYEEIGTGKPLIMLHGDTASSKMFEMLLPLYQDQFRVILIDFLGNGRSQRLEAFPADLWISQADQTVALLEHLDCGKANLLGTSGGAWTAINTALKRPDLVGRVIADSFDGRTLPDDFVKNLLEERTAAKKDRFAKQFYQWCQGEDWERVVDLNTDALVACAQEKRPLFCEPLEGLKVPVLFSGSQEDDMCRQDLEAEYWQMERLVPDGMVHIFEKGGHPAMLSSAEEFADIAKKFLAIGN